MPKSNSDPHNVRGRLYDQVAKVLDELERKPKRGEEPIGLKERVSALTAIGRLEVIFVGLRKEDTGGRASGSAVRKYANAFQQNAARRGAHVAGSAEPDGDDDPASGDDADDDTDLAGDAA